MTDARLLPRNERRLAKKQLEKDRLAWPPHLVQLQDDEMPKRPELKGRMCREVWRSRDFLLQVYKESPTLERLSINRTQILGSGWRRVGANFTEQTMTSATAADLVTITGLTIPVTAPVKIVVVWRKSATAGQMSIGLKINATIVAEADTTANTGIGIMTVTNEVQSGYSIVEFGPRSTSYLTAMIVSYMVAGASGQSSSLKGAAVLTAALPNATITDIIIRGDSDGTATLGVKEVYVYQG